MGMLPNVVRTSARTARSSAIPATALGAQPAEVSFGVTGMTCTSCAATIERNLRKVPGVQTARVNFASERATVTFVPGQASLPDLIAGVERAGYGVATGEADVSTAFCGLRASIHKLP